MFEELLSAQMDKTSYLAAFCARDSSLGHPALLMRPGIGRNMSCTVDDLA